MGVGSDGSATSNTVNVDPTTANARSPSATTRVACPYGHRPTISGQPSADTVRNTGICETIMSATRTIVFVELSGGIFTTRSYQLEVAPEHSSRVFEARGSQTCRRINFQPRMMLPASVPEGATLSIVRPSRNTEPESQTPNNAKNGTPVNTPCPCLENGSLAYTASDCLLRMPCPLVRMNPVRSTTSSLMIQQFPQNSSGHSAMRKNTTPQKSRGGSEATLIWISEGGRVGGGGREFE